MRYNTEICQIKSNGRGALIMPKGNPSKRYAPEFKIMAAETMNKIRKV